MLLLKTRRYLYEFLPSLKVFCINLSCITVNGLSTGAAFHYFIVLQVVLPDVEFFVNLGDWPLEKKSLAEDPIPVFSWCGSDDTKDIVMPTYDLTEATIQMMHRYMYCNHVYEKKNACMIITEVQQKHVIFSYVQDLLLKVFTTDF